MLAATNTMITKQVAITLPGILSTPLPMVTCGRSIT